MDTEESIAWDILNKRMQDIKPICLDCKAMCCRRGHVKVTKEQADFITKKFPKAEILDLKNNTTVLILRNNCPCLKDNLCSIHSSEYKPKMCSTFPIHIEGKTVHLASKCLAVQQSFFYPATKELHMKGYSVTMKGYNE